MKNLIPKLNWILITLYKRKGLRSKWKSHWNLSCKERIWRRTRTKNKIFFPLCFMRNRAKTERRETWEVCVWTRGEISCLTRRCVVIHVWHRGILICTLDMMIDILCLCLGFDSVRWCDDEE
jgi:hypothetical protein